MGIKNVEQQTKVFPDAKWVYPILMVSERNAVFLFINRDYAVCMRPGEGGDWDLGEGGDWDLGELRAASIKGLRVFKGVVSVENS